MDDERLAIRWHMGGRHAHDDKEREDLGLARQSQLWSVIKSADRTDASKHLVNILCNISQKLGVTF